MTTSAAGSTGITFASVQQAVPAIQDISDMLAAFKTLGTVPAAVAGSGCPATGAAITALGAEIVGVVVELVEKLETDAKNLASNIEKYVENEAATVLGLNTVAGGLGGAATAAKATTATVASPLVVSPTAAPVSVVPPTVDNSIAAPAAINTNGASSLNVGGESTTLSGAVNNNSTNNLIADTVTGPSVAGDLGDLGTISV